MASFGLNSGGMSLNLLATPANAFQSLTSVCTKLQILTQLVPKLKAL